MLGFGDDHRLCAKPLLRPERVTDVHIRCGALWQFGKRVGQLLDGYGIQIFHHSGFGYGLLSVVCAGGLTDIGNPLK